MLLKQNLPKSNVFHVLAYGSTTGCNIRSTSQMIWMKIKNIILRHSNSCKTFCGFYSFGFNRRTKLYRWSWYITWSIKNWISRPAFRRFLVFLYWFKCFAWVRITRKFWCSINTLLCWRSGRTPNSCKNLYVQSKIISIHC